MYADTFCILKKVFDRIEIMCSTKKQIINLFLLCVIKVRTSSSSIGCVYTCVLVMCWAIGVCVGSLMFCSASYTDSSPLLTKVS